IELLDWKQIRAEYQRHRHAAFPAREGGWHARNSEQQWIAAFDGQGFSVTPDEMPWRWGLELAGVLAHPPVVVDVNRITYRWNAAVEEWYLNDARGLEHGFTLYSPRAIRLRVRGTLQPHSTNAGVEFVDDDGVARVRYTGLAAWDATGRGLPARMTVDKG